MGLLKRFKMIFQLAIAAILFYGGKEIIDATPNSSDITPTVLGALICCIVGLLFLASVCCNMPKNMKK